jgi:putative FmdB family regulatory protein
MPTYEYACNACGENFELYQPITARPVRKCPACGELRAKRLLGAGAGIIFRGSGFYETDYRSAEYKAKAKAETEKATTTSTVDGAESTKPSKPKTKAKARKNGAKAKE